MNDTYESEPLDETKHLTSIFPIPRPYIKKVKAYCERNGLWEPIACNRRVYRLRRKLPRLRVSYSRSGSTSTTASSSAILQSNPSVARSPRRRRRSASTPASSWLPGPIYITVCYHLYMHVYSIYSQGFALSYGAPKNVYNLYIYIDVYCMVTYMIRIYYI